MENVTDIGKKVFEKYNQLIIQPSAIANPTVYTFTKDNMIFVVESGAAGLMGHSHELYEVQNEIPNAIISFKMANNCLHEHPSTYFIAKSNNSYAIYKITNNIVTINTSSETMLHTHSLKIREIFKDSIRVFSDYRHVQIISNKKYTFEIQIDKGILLEHIHDIHQIPIPKEKKFRNVEIAFVFKENIFHEHAGMYYIEKDDGEFVIKLDKLTVHTTTPDDKVGKHDHNIKLVRVTKRVNNKNVLLEDPVPPHVANDIYNAAKILLQLT